MYRWNASFLYDVKGNIFKFPKQQIAHDIFSMETYLHATLICADLDTGAPMVLFPVHTYKPVSIQFAYLEPIVVTFDIASPTTLPLNIYTQVIVGRGLPSDIHEKFHFSDSFTPISVIDNFSETPSETNQIQSQ